MIKIKISKDQFIAIINVITGIIKSIDGARSGMNRDMEYASLMADHYVLMDMSRKMRSKYIIIEDMPGSKKITYSFSAIQAYCLIKNFGTNNSDPFHMATMQQVSNNIYKHLLA